MNRFKWGGLSAKGIYLDETVMRMCHTHRRLLAQLALLLTREGKNDKAKNVLQKMEKEIPEYNVPMNYIMSNVGNIVEAYNATGQKGKAKKLLETVWKNSTQYVNWYLSLNGRGFSMSQNDCYREFYIMSSVLEDASKIDQKWVDKHELLLHKYIDQYQAKGGVMPE